VHLIETQLIISKELGYLQNLNIITDLEKVKIQLLGLIKYLKNREETP